MKNILLKSIKSILTFYEQYEKSTQIDDNDRKYILFKIDIYFNEYSLAVEIEKKDVNRDLIFEVKRQKALEKKTQL